jgi:hypothetical protein
MSIPASEPKCRLSALRALEPGPLLWAPAQVKITSHLSAAGVHEVIMVVLTRT